MSFDSYDLLLEIEKKGKKTKVIMQICFGRRFGVLQFCRQTRKVRNLFHMEIDSDDRKMTNGQNQWTTSQKLSNAVGCHGRRKKNAQAQLKKTLTHTTAHKATAKNYILSMWHFCLRSICNHFERFNVCIDPFVLSEGSTGWIRFFIHFNFVFSSLSF